MIKGHTKIELTNVKTGQKQVIEDDNMITNAMSKMFEQMPFFQIGNPANPFTKSSPLIDRLCGGILLFADPIDEDPDNYFTPSGNIMVGNARVNYASANDVPEFGAYNAEESTWNPKTGERKYVYDFTTSKGNGTISCVCLTNPLVGYYGLGNTSGKKEVMKVENVDYNSIGACNSYFWNTSNKAVKGSLSTTSEIGSLSTPIILFADYNENCIYAIDRYAFEYSSNYSDRSITSGILSIYKCYFPMKSVNPMEYFGSEFKFRLTERIDLEVPSVIKSIPTGSTHRACVCRCKDALYIVFTGNSNYQIKANTDFYVWKIGYDLTTSEVYTLNNTTGVDICNSSRTLDDLRSYNYTDTMMIVDGYLLCSSYSGNKVFKMKLSDPTDVTEFTNLLYGGTSQCYYRFYKLGNTVMIWDYNGSKNFGVVNLSTNSIYPVNGKPTYHSGTDVVSNKINIPINGNDNFVINSWGEQLSHDYNYIALNSFMLSTINNLSEPVVKTADLAMKITYTLSLDTSEEEQEAGDS